MEGSSQKPYDTYTNIRLYENPKIIGVCRASENRVYKLRKSICLNNYYTIHLPPISAKNQPYSEVNFIP